MARRTVTISEEYGAFWINGTALPLSVQSASLEGALRKAAVQKGVIHKDGFLEIRSTQDAVDIIDTLLGPRDGEAA